MPSKRRNNGRSKHGRGHVKAVVCSHCGRQVAKVFIAYLRTKPSSGSRLGTSSMPVPRGISLRPKPSNVINKSFFV
jgi:hypothetical protein